MKKIAAIALAAAVSGASLSAQGESSYSITMDFPYVSDYVFRGIQFGDDAIQPSVEFATGDFYAGIWTSLPISNRSSMGWEDEYDFYAGYGVALSDAWALDFGATYYYYPSSGSHLFEPFVGAAGDLGGGFSASFYYFYETEDEVSTYQVDLGYSIELSDTSTLDLAGAYGIASDPYDYNYWSVSATFNVAMNDAAGAYLGAVLTDNDIAGDTSEDFYFITGVSVGF